MDNTKTGAFIKALRTERSLTQRELAERLHITDRAVSKWERGLSAPDIALLEPLGEILGVSVVELIHGERLPPEEHTPVMEERTRDVLAYSGQETRRRVRETWKAAALIAPCVLILAGLWFFLWGWWTGAFFLLDDCPSPDGRFPTKVYGKELDYNGFFHTFNWQDCVTVTEDRRNCSMYPGTAYKGLYWSPDSKKYVLALDREGKTALYVEWLYTSVCGNLNAMIHDAMNASKLREDYGLPWDDQVDLEFIQWGPDGDTMLVWYSFTGEEDGLEHTGYFWYDCELVCLSGLFELDVERESDFPFSPSARSGERDAKRGALSKNTLATTAFLPYHEVGTVRSQDARCHHGRAHLFAEDEPGPPPGGSRSRGKRILYFLRPRSGAGGPPAHFRGRGQHRPGADLRRGEHAGRAAAETGGQQSGDRGVRSGPVPGVSGGEARQISGPGADVRPPVPH